MRKIKRWLLITIASPPMAGLILAGFAGVCGQLLACRAKEKMSVLRKIGTERGICAVLGDAKCELALKLATQSELLIYVQLPRREDAETARKVVDDAGFYGTRIFIETGPLTHLHLADNLADALIAAGPATSISETEVLRVLRPEGKALLGDKVLIKNFLGEKFPIVWPVWFYSRVRAVNVVLQHRDGTDDELGGRCAGFMGHLDGVTAGLEKSHRLVRTSPRRLDRKDGFIDPAQLDLRV